MEEMINMDDLEIREEWISGIEVDYAEYDGAAFTGAAYEKTEYYYSEYKFVNGYIHGRCFSVYTNGQPCNESFMEHGITLEKTRWYQSGAKREYYKKEPMINQYWSENGILLEDENDKTRKIFYPSGKLKSLYIGNDEKIYYDESGEWVVRIKAEYNDYVVTDIKNMNFNDDFISKNYMGLLMDYEFYKYFIIWLNDKNGDERGDIIIDMIKSDVPWHKSNGINLAGTHNVRKAIPYIRLELNNNVKPPEHRDHRDIPQSSYGWTIGKTAKTALGRMGV